MRTITLTHVDLSGFKSFSASVEVCLDRSSGMTLMAGDNRVEPRLGANGVGKSTLFQAIEFCLYGPPVRGLRIGDLVSWGGKQASVAVVLDVDGEEHEVRRSGPPERLRVDGKPADQAAVHAIVGLTRRQFLNSVVFGQAVPLFIDLPIPERGDLLDEVLDLQLWMRAADRAGKRASEAAASISRLRIEIGRTEGAASALEPVEDIRAREAAWEEERGTRVAQVVAGIRERMRDLAALREPSEEEASWEQEHGDRVADLSAALEAGRKALADLGRAAAPGVLPDTAALRGAAQEARRLEAELSARRVRVDHELADARGDVEFFDETGECPSCGQQISRKLADRHLRELREKIAGLTESAGRLDAELEDAGKRADAAAAAVDAAEGMRRVRERDEAVARERAASIRREVSGLEAQLAREESAENPHTALRRERDAVLRRDLDAWRQRKTHAEGEVNPHTASIVRVEAEAVALAEKLRQQQRRETHLRSRQQQLEFWQQGFRRVRLFCMRRVLQQLDLETMNAAQSLGLVGWRIGYSTETETKSGSQKLGVQVEVQSPDRQGSFSSWSGGEGQRVRLSTARGFGDLIQRWCGVRWRLEGYDEPTAWLSGEGIEGLLEMLRTRADSMDKVVLVADHRGLQHAGFSRVMMIAKGPEGSFVQ